MSLPPVRRPARVRLLDLGDRLLAATRLRPNAITPEAAKADAARATGLDDFGPDDFEEGLAVFCRAAEEEGRLDIVGRAVVRAFLRRVLSNRLLLVDYRKHPEDEAALLPPIIVVGLPRTGTTFLHRVLAQAPDAYGPPTWQMWRPLPRPSGADRRREIALKSIAGLSQLSPELDSKHYQDADEPEECYHLLDPAFHGLGPIMICPASGYLDWVQHQDMRPAYRMYHEYLRILQTSAPGKRLTLKSPVHTPYLAEIAAEIPGVRFVQTHRDVVEVTGSCASLSHSLLTMTKPGTTGEEIGKATLDLLCWLAESGMKQRDRSELPVVDVQYRDLIADPVATVKRIYAELDLPWTGAVATAMREAVSDRPQHKKGRHSYELSDFGLTESGVRSALAEYAERYLRAS